MVKIPCCLFRLAESQAVWMHLVIKGITSKRAPRGTNGVVVCKTVAASPVAGTTATRGSTVGLLWTSVGVLTQLLGVLGWGVRGLSRCRPARRALMSRRNVEDAGPVLA